MISAFAQVLLIDAHTDAEPGTAAMREATAPLPAFDWKNEPGEASAEQAQQIRTAVQTLFAGAVSTEVGSLLSGR